MLAIGQCVNQEESSIPGVKTPMFKYWISQLFQYSISQIIQSIIQLGCPTFEHGRGTGACPVHHDWLQTWHKGHHHWSHLTPENVKNLKKNWSTDCEDEEWKTVGCLSSLQVPARNWLLCAAGIIVMIIISHVVQKFSYYLDIVFWCDSILCWYDIKMAMIWSQSF